MRSGWKVWRVEGCGFASQQRVRAKKVPRLARNRSSGPRVVHVMPSNTAQVCMDSNCNHTRQSTSPVETSSSSSTQPSPPSPPRPLRRSFPYSRSNSLIPSRVLAPTTVAMATDLWYVAPSSASGQLEMPQPAVPRQLHHLARVQSSHNPP